MTHLPAGSPSTRAGAPTPVGASTFTTYVEETPKLCGFLLKQSDSSAASIAASKAASAAATIGLHANAGRLPMRKRWFVFNETTCRLYWYKSPSDLDSLGDVDVLAAAFEVVVEDPKNLTTFKINTKERSLVLEASDSKTMMYWLQELQSQRQKHVKTLTRNGPPGMRIPRPPSPRTRRKQFTKPTNNNNNNNNTNNNVNHINNNNNNNDDPEKRSLVSVGDVIEDELKTSLPTSKGREGGGGGGGAGGAVRETASPSFDELLPHVDAPVDSVGAGSAILGGGGGGGGLGGPASFFPRRRSFKGKMLKLLPTSGSKKPDDVNGVTTTTTTTAAATTTTTTKDSLIDFDASPLAAKPSHGGNEEGGIPVLQRSPDLHRRAAAASSTSVAAADSFPVTPASGHFYAPSGEAVPPFVSSTTSLPDAANQNSFTSGLSNLFKLKNVSPSISNSNLSSPACQRCHALADQMRSALKEIESLRDEREAQRDCHTILTQQLEFQQRKLDARDSVHNPGDLNRWAEDREQELLNLKSVLQKCQEDLEIRRRKVEVLESDASKAVDQIEMLQELIKCKDEVVCKLTDQLFEAEKKSSQTTLAADAPPARSAATPTPSRTGNAFFPRLTSSGIQAASTTCNHCEKQIQDLESELAAYKFQNQVCNKEILEQNQLRADLHDWGRQLCEQLVEYEAKLCQAKSERDFLLNEKKKTRESSASSKRSGGGGGIGGGGGSAGGTDDDNADDDGDDVLERMIEDAMEEAVVDQAAAGSKSRLTVGNGAYPSGGSVSNGLYYDEYGFLKGQNGSSANHDDDALLTKAKSFDMYSRDLQDSLGEPGDYEVSRRVKWENYVTSQWAMGGAKGDLVRSPDLKTLVRTGIPCQYRLRKLCGLPPKQMNLMKLRENL